MILLFLMVTSSVIQQAINGVAISPNRLRHDED